MDEVYKGPLMIDVATVWMAGLNAWIYEPETAVEVYRWVEPQQ